MNMPGLMMQLSVFPPPRARFQCRLTVTAANPAIAFQVQSPPNNADFDSALVPFAGSDGGKSALHELVQTKPSTIICGLRCSFLPDDGGLGSIRPCRLRPLPPPQSAPGS
jgi:hypothetical protein